MKVKFKGVYMAYYRMERIKAMRPLIHRANDGKRSIPQAAKWLGWSTSSLRNWIKILGIGWKRRYKRNGYALDKSRWLEHIKKAQAAGKSQSQMAAELNVGEWNISRFIKDNELQIPSRRNKLIP
jgi:hypothetical protein